MLKYLLCIIPYIVAYILGSFVQWTLDASQWTESARMFAVLFATMGSSTVAINLFIRGE